MINTAGGGSFRAANSNANTLTAATFNGTLDLATGTGIERVAGGLTLNGAVNINNNSVLSFSGDQTLSGTGSIVLGNTGASNRALGLEGNTTLTIGSNIVVRGENGTLGQAYLSGGTQSLINNGRISADVSGGTFNLAPSHGVTNNGVLEAKNGGTLVLNANVAGTPSGSIVAGAGSTVLQNGVTLSGTINSAGTGNFRVANDNGNVLSGVTFNGPLDLASSTSVERVTGGLTLNGTISVNNNSVLSFNGNQTLDGAGTIVLGDTGASNRALALEGNTTLTVGSAIVVRGQNGTVGQTYLSGGTQVLVNNGQILADVGGGLIDLSAQQTNNAGTLGAANGGILRLNNNVTNTGSGHIDSAKDSTVLQNGVTVAGGTINTVGTGRFSVSNSNANVLSGVSLNGTIDLASATGIERVVNGLTLTGGSIVKINSNSVLSFAGGNQTLGGSGTIELGNTGASNRALSMEGNTTLTVGPNVVIHGVNGTIGQTYLSGGTQNLVNNGTINADGGGTITVGVSGALTNGGLLRAQNGTLSIANPLSGSGTLQVDSTGVMNLANSPNTQGKLVMGAAGSTLNIGTKNLTINTDYTNAAAGTGNAFNRRAGISGAGQVVAGGDVAQAITGAAVTNGDTTNATLTINNVRVGSTTYNYQIANNGTTGPALRGALQTNVNGANLTDARLSGAGVTASNYTTGGPGSNTGDLGVTFTAAAAGALAVERPGVEPAQQLREHRRPEAQYRPRVRRGGLQRRRRQHDARTDRDGGEPAHRRLQARVADRRQHRDRGRLQRRPERPLRQQHRRGEQQRRQHQRTVGQREQQQHDEGRSGYDQCRRQDRYGDAQLRNRRCGQWRQQWPGCGRGQCAAGSQRQRQRLSPGATEHDRQRQLRQCVVRLHADAHTVGPQPGGDGWFLRGTERGLRQLRRRQRRELLGRWRHHRTARRQQ